MKDLKTSIYRILACSVLVLSLFSCEAEFDLPAYPTLSGTYEISSVRVTGQNLITGELISEDFNRLGEYYSMVNPVGPFDVLEIGEKIHFTYAKMYGGHYLINGGQAWYYDYMYNTYQDLATGEYRRITLDSYEGTRRVYNIIQDGIDYLILSSSGQWEDGSPEGTFTKFTMHLERTGP